MPDTTPTSASPEPRRPCLLVALEDSLLGRHTAGIGVAVAARMGCDVVFLVAIPIEHIEARSPAGMAQALAEHRQRCHDKTVPLFEQALGQARAAGIDGRTVLTIDEAPATAIQRIADEQDCQIILVGSHGRGTVARVLHGSLVADLVRLSRRPVLVCREDMHLGIAAAVPTGAAAAG